jgi:threonine/homoserine/homoserine lactone efflux protein
VPDPTLIFLLKATGTSLSGVLAPGALTAATLEAGARRKHAGAWVAVGHGVVELPLMVLIVLGLAFPTLFGVTDLLQEPAFRISVGLAGGAALFLMAGLTLWGLRPKATGSRKRATGRNGAPQEARHLVDEPLAGGAEPPPAVPAGKLTRPLLAGIVLSAGNPYFLFWWATVGLGLTAQAYELGVLAFVLFAIIHWLCDFLWLEVLSMTSFYGTVLLGPRTRQVISAACGVAMAGFGVMFAIDAARAM